MASRKMILFKMPRKSNGFSMREMSARKNNNNSYKANELPDMSNEGGEERDEDIRRAGFCSKCKETLNFCDCRKSKEPGSLFDEY